MHMHAEQTPMNTKITERKATQSAEHAVSAIQRADESTFPWVDNRPETVQLKTFQGLINNRTQAKQIAQKKSRDQDSSLIQIQEEKRRGSKKAVFQLQKGGPPLPGRRKRRRMAQEAELAEMDTLNAEWKKNRDKEESNQNTNPFAVLAEEKDDALPNTEEDVFTKEEEMSDPPMSSAPTIEDLKSTNNNVQKIRELLSGYESDVAGKMSRLWRAQSSKYKSLSELERAAKSKLGIEDKPISTFSRSTPLASGSNLSSLDDKNSPSRLSKAERKKRNKARRGTPLSLSSPDVGTYLNTLHINNHKTFKSIVIFTLNNNDSFNEIHLHRDGTKKVIQISLKQTGQEGNGTPVQPQSLLFKEAVEKAKEY